MSAPIVRAIAGLTIVLFVTNTLFAPVSFAQVAFLPAAGTMVSMTGKFNPVVIKGMQLYPDNPFKFDFIVDTGDTTLSQELLKEEGQKLISYFLASLTTPEKDMWVNLSPYEKDRIIPTAFGDTEMGKELLSQDYLLKQIMATALYPQRELGRQFWQKVYSEAQLRFGTTNVPVNTFNKVWILPDKAMVYENSRMNSVFVVESSLKVMLEQDYLAAKKNANVIPAKAGTQDISAIGSQIIREIVIPALQKEVNEGRNFAPLRQVYQSLILAAWYKKNLKDNVITQAYVDRNKTKGVDVADKNITQKIYKQYLQAYRKGVYNFIKEDMDPVTQTEVPRKYFSGGMTFLNVNVQKTTDPAMAASFIKNNSKRLVDMSMVADLANPARLSGGDNAMTVKGAAALLAALVAISVASVNIDRTTSVATDGIIRVGAVFLGATLYAMDVSDRVFGRRPGAVEAAVPDQNELTHKSKTDRLKINSRSFIDRWRELMEDVRSYPAPVVAPLKVVPLPRPRPQVPEAPKSRIGQTRLAAYGGIDLEKVDVNTRGGGVRTAFSDPEQLKMLLNADGLVPVIYKIQPLTVLMINMLLGL